MDKTILHLDMNSYFATAEQQFEPKLRGAPVGVIKGPGRTCVIAASIEAKKFGVKTGTTTWEATQKCPGIIFVPAHMHKYLELTRKMIKVAQDYSPTVEVFSIDEVFLDVTDTQTLFSGGVFEIAMTMKWRIKQELGEWMRCSIGVGFNKLTAKMASEMKKPDGLTFLTRENYLQATEKIAVGEVCGIGRAYKGWLQERGIYSLGQARKASLPVEIESLVWLRGGDELETKNEPAKSVSRTYTTHKTLNSKYEILKLIRNLVEEVAERLRQTNVGGRTICLKVDKFWVRKTLTNPTDDPLIVFNLLKQEYLKNEQVDVRFVGVNISNLIPDSQILIFNKPNKVLEATDKVNKKFGGFTIYPAALLGTELIRPETCLPAGEVTGFSIVRV